MGKEIREIQKTVRGLEGLNYVEIRNVPMTVDAKFGNLIDASTVEQMERAVATEMIIKRLPIRGMEVKFLRSIFALSQREFAEKLGLSHVSIFKWEKNKNRRLDVVNEIAVKVLAVGLLGLKIVASIDALVGQSEFPKRIVLDFESMASRRAGKTETNRRAPICLLKHI